MKKSKSKIAIKIIASLFVIIIVLAALQRLVMPKYMSDTVEGALIAEYYDEVMDHDVIFIGDCEVYENFTPAVLWEEYGINSYIRGSAQQLIWQSYYLLEETLTYETPEVVVFNVLSMKYDTPQREAYNRMTLDGMRWSSSKWNSILASMTEDESMLDYIFPILRYHSRWSDLSLEDFKYYFTKDKVSYNGYYLRVDALAAENVPTDRPLADYTFGDNAYYYLDKMVELCEEKGVTLVLIKAPSLYPTWYDEWEEQIEEYAAAHGLAYYNFLEVIDEIGLDFTTDTYDAGLHLNLYGAKKLTSYFGEILSTEFGLMNRQGEEELEAIWAEKLERYYNDIAEAEVALEAE